jgi:hypothetical protein
MIFEPMSGHGPFDDAVKLPVGLCSVYNRLTMGRYLNRRTF